MRRKTEITEIKMIPISDIHILNPRTRNKRIFEEITDNIMKVGLKRPITVILSKKTSDKPFTLVCGQGRLEAFTSCGQTKIPAITIEANEEKALIMSLIENCARRHHSALDLLKGIEVLLSQGYSKNQISTKTGLTLAYVNSIIKLIERNEERLITAVEAGHLPIHIAIKISDSPEEEQAALQEAYESNQLRGNKFMKVKSLLDARRREGKLYRDRKNNNSMVYKRKTLSGRDIQKIYKKEVDRMRSMLRRSNIVRDQMTFVIEALRALYGEDTFNNLLEKEGLTTLPQPISEIISKRITING